MAAGISVYYDLNGGMTADLVKNQWPARAGEPPPKEYGTTAHNIGTGIRCNADQSFRPPSCAAGTSKRIGAFYEKTGVSQHRTEPGFRETKGMATLTEVPVPNYGTLKRSMNSLPSAGSLVLGGGRDDDTMSRRSRSSAASGRSRASAARSQRTQSSRGGMSAVSEAPSWTQRIGNPPPFNFESLPIYERTNEAYGRGARTVVQCRPAGKSESGFLDPAELVAKLTRP
mmetsp:Transcript_86189/g.168585  ORF Transcript_86189/g.168585 Transcript_86189/m.168585 type:complete len:228 (+) Transcript_86189:75-758(+)|eukprot:CAMPEP_0170245302 /NCGR_PEP_ID=MMETSP0116_2-20130129/22435_1 /TAXON_ID=400756 /ORGANISM="Durinskia baltica, Strain CSIRO CS-38" /LENGTH=227 /DNA_ID=CAMNT_0010496173 /DNA_START=81 /DNA_END=764 /DNA_ORIENTATION=+